MCLSRTLGAPLTLVVNQRSRAGSYDAPSLYFTVETFGFCPPHTTIREPVHTAVWRYRSDGTTGGKADDAPRHQMSNGVFAQVAVAMRTLSRPASNTAIARNSSAFSLNALTRPTGSARITSAAFSLVASGSRPNDVWSPRASPPSSSGSADPFRATTVSR